MSFVARTSPRHSLSATLSKPRTPYAIAAVISALLFVLPVLGFPAANARAQTQAQLNDEACGAYKKADAEMNRAYGLIMRNYRRDRGFISTMRKAQLAWIRYRDAHLESIFPGDPRQYGSVNPMCRCTSLEEMTKERTQILNRWVEGIEEGDVCAGSVKVE
jgi:uncharacterized protein YecT (DUF1311 family)